MPTYAAGVLTGGAEDAVRRHLAGGCRECLDALFGQPIGVTRGLKADPKPIRGTVSVVTAVLSVIALMGTVFASTMWLTSLWRSPTTTSLSHGRFSALEADAADAQVRLESLARRSTSLEAHLRPLSPAWQVGPRSAPADPAHRAATSLTEQALVQLGAALSLPGTRIDALRSAIAATGARGWMIRDALHGRLFVYAVGLPRLPAAWEAHIVFGSTLHRLSLRRRMDGSLWGIMDRIEASTCAVHVSIVPPGADRTVLEGDLACRIGPRA